VADGPRELSVVSLSLAGAVAVATVGQGWVSPSQSDINPPSNPIF